MNLFSNAFRGSKPINGYVGDMKQVISCNSGQSILGAINRFKDYLNTKSGYVDTLIASLTLSSDLISDNVADNSTVGFNGTLDDFSVVPSDVADQLISGFQEACHNGKDLDDKSGITITDSSGYIYNIIDVRSDNTAIEGQQVLFASNEQPSSLSDCILVRDQHQGVIRINNFIRTNNFIAGTYQPRIKQNDSLFLIQDLLIMMGWDGVNDDIYTNVCQLNNYSSEDDTIIGQLEYYLNEHHGAGIDYDGTVLNTLSQLWDIKATDVGEWINGAGKTALLWNVAYDLVESSTLNTYLSKACDSILSGFNSSTAISALITETATSKFKSIRSFGSGIYSAFHRGGVYGVACYVLSYIKDMTEVDEDDGLLHFTDNSRLTPQIYIVGIVNTVITVASTLVAIIVSIFSRIAGAVIAVIGQVIVGIVKAISYDYDSTLAAINTSDKVIAPTAPYGIIQQTHNVDDIENEDLLALFAQGVNVVYLEIPGSIVIIGPGEMDDNGEITKIRCEIHPLVIDPGEAFDTIVDLISNDVMVSYDGNIVQLSLRLYYDPDDIRARTIANIYSAYVQNTIIDNDDTDHVSQANDALLREYILKNLFITGVFLNYVCSTSFMNTNNEFFSEEWAGHQYTYYLTHGNDEICGFWAGFHAFAENRVLDEQSPITLYLRKPGVASWNMTWAEIYAMVIAPLSGPVASNLNLIWEKGLYYGEINSLPSGTEHSIYIPKYDSKSFWAVIIGSAIVSAAVAVASAIVVYKVRRAISKQRAINQAKVAQAQQSLIDDPTDENYTTLRRAVFKNNMWSNIIGGSKFDYVSYWNGDTKSQQSNGSTVGSVYTTLRQSGILGNNSDPEYSTTLTQLCSQQDVNANDIKSIIRLIAGPYTPLNR